MRPIIAAVLSLVHDSRLSPLVVEPDHNSGTVFHQHTAGARRAHGEHTVVLSLMLYVDAARRKNQDVDTCVLSLCNIVASEQALPSAKRVLTCVAALRVSCITFPALQQDS